MAPRVILGQEYSSYELNGDSESLFRIAAIFHENSLVQAIILGKDCLIDWMNGDLHERTTVRLQDNFKPSGAPCLLSFDGELHLLLPTMNQAGKSRLEHWKAKNRTDSWSHFCSIDEHVTESKLAFGSFQGRMFCVYVRGPENALQWRVNNGKGWSDASQVPSEYTRSTPALLEIHGRLRLYFVCDNEVRNIRYTVLSVEGNNWHEAATLDFQVAQGSGVAGANGAHGAILMWVPITNTKPKPVMCIVWNHQSEYYGFLDCLRDFPGVLPVVAQNPVTSEFHATWRQGNRLCQTKGLPIAAHPPRDFSYANWMSCLDGSQLLSSISLPGTHDSAARVPQFLMHAAKTQHMTIRDQLLSGIRYFDMRSNDDLMTCHGRSDLFKDDNREYPLGLGDCFNDMYEFLRDHPTECLLVQVQREHDRMKISDKDFNNKMDWILDQKKEMWRLDRDIPTVDQLRGRIQLIRRFHIIGGALYGIDVNNWGGGLWGSPARFQVQDNYQLDIWGMREKREQITKLRERANDPVNEGVLFINFLSCSVARPVLDPVPDPKTGAYGWTGILGANDDEGLNRFFLNCLNQLAEKRQETHLGAIVMDFPQEHDELIRGIVRTNFPYYACDMPL